MKRHVVVIGGGVAGLSTAYFLAKQHVRVTVLEREALAFAHSSGRNAAIYRPLEESSLVTELASRVPTLLSSLGAGSPLLNPCGLTLTACAPEAMQGLLKQAESHQVQHRLLDKQALRETQPGLGNGQSGCGLHLTAGGILDLHGIAETLRRAAIDCGAKLRTSVEVSEICRGPNGVQGVLIADGTQIAASEVVLAAGAWTSDLLKTCDVPLSLIPHRRHLALLALPTGVSQPTSVTWDLDTGIYLRPEGRGLLACPGDHTPSRPGLPSVDPAQLERLAELLPRIAPLYRDSEVRTAWACLRTMSADQNMVAGQVSDSPGLWVFAALAGHGMSAGLAAGEMIARGVLGKESSLLAKLSPSRFLKA